MLKLRLTEESAILSRKLLVLTILTAVILIFSTYAWFIGIRTIGLESYNIFISSTESLLVSLDGQSWSEEVKFNEDDIEKISYDEHSNNWPKLIPMSSIGEIDFYTSRMKLYEQTSLRGTPGGQRIISKRVNNYGSGMKEQPGYVVFDMFMRNVSSAQYNKELNPLNEELMFLTYDSGAKVSKTGVSGMGAENTIRVAFVQIGRVIGTTTDRSIITGMKCNQDPDSEVTGICRTQIWEPNDTKHEKNAIKWYNNNCKRRIGWDIYSKASYSGNCKPIVDGEYYPTYAIKREIYASDNVNIYDGEAYNYYDSTALFDYPYFTDTISSKEGEDREVFMTLEPNSITKIRLYIYLEGQDIDNYNYANLTEKISIRFGFTKERYNSVPEIPETPDNTEENNEQSNTP